ncbi:unnamed protein product [Mesocestoides corti]|uniref:Uncharacterized protein n=1 Tax=Mesocestoides corti TaxID=53468 RepID=A0A0R3UF15_MESCO|nr:unnamed protein product [Mesocestoides corti]
MLSGFKVSRLVFGNVVLKRMISMRLKSALELHEPCAPRPDSYPKWSSSPSELFTELRDGKYCRDAVNEGLADFIPITISELPLLYRLKHVNFKYALIMVSPPDKHGFCTLGSAVGSARSAIQNAEKIIAQVNPQTPITYGDSTIHISQIDYLVQGSEPLFEVPPPQATATEQKIAAIIAEQLIDDGATIQLGFGNIPPTVASNLRSHKDLGVHAETIFDGIVDLVNLGVVTNKFKPVRPGRIVASYAIGTKRIYDFINENPLVGLYDIAWTNSTETIARNPKVTSVNTCMEMDLTGQSVGDGIGGHLYSGVGGQLDFTRGASLSSDGLGRPIITMCSLNSDGNSSIVPTLSRGSTVVATRAHVHYVVTEYGIANLFGKTLRQRAYALIQIAHPKFRWVIGVHSILRKGLCRQKFRQCITCSA